MHFAGFKMKGVAIVIAFLSLMVWQGTVLQYMKSGSYMFHEWLIHCAVVHNFIITDKQPGWMDIMTSFPILLFLNKQPCNHHLPDTRRVICEHIMAGILPQLTQSHFMLSKIPVRG